VLKIEIFSALQMGFGTSCSWRVGLEKLQVSIRALHVNVLVSMCIERR
jgi:hypothetical protein